MNATPRPRLILLCGLPGSGKTAVILECGFRARSERDEKRLGARALGVPVELHHLSAPIDELCRRLEARSVTGGSGTAPVTREMLQEYVKLFEAPDDAELGLYDQPPPGRPD